MTGSLPDELLIKTRRGSGPHGKVFDYQDNEGAAMTPKVDFSVTLIENEQKVIWASKSYNQRTRGHCSIGEISRRPMSRSGDGARH
jgi:hypothetical protein